MKVCTIMYRQSLHYYVVHMSARQERFTRICVNTIRMNILCITYICRIGKVYTIMYHIYLSGRKKRRYYVLHRSAGRGKCTLLCGAHFVKARKIVVSPFCLHRFLVKKLSGLYFNIDVEYLLYFLFSC